MSGNSTPRLRCAVYTRKSSEEGLDQEFNSLDAQREACVAFIASQIGLGWKLIPDRYDDGGISGGTMERPALQRLLQDIRNKKVDVVVVYKIDRLTRSLMDFSKIVEIFDASAVSFVSVTQQFNTTTSMGRLTLNVLLSFAQFEREVTAERIRDKIAASKKKGMWMGGVVPLGYRVEHRKLVIDDAEAKIVRHLFDRYLVLKSVRDLADEAARGGLVTRTRERRDGTVSVTKPFGRGNLHHLLSNPIYIGKIKHKEQVHDGEHQPIIAGPVFDAAQALLASQAPPPEHIKRHPATSSHRTAFRRTWREASIGACQQARRSLSILRLKTVR
ncbi:recombinase family protein [Mesorhizobium sp. ESP7-2]|uniref:recombinase family protein n=1 Tax=Mesorhizobium sp. ESP7-2 TaxID=2876622 RepID=UPI001CCD45F4|nr:recombinase family protein [Mesorhizobium sp. ESP7-2]MBZ9711157.1 recombinase family protein [Mesorhizobium sp. ESP7-2]